MGGGGGSINWIVNRHRSAIAETLAAEFKAQKRELRKNGMNGDDVREMDEAMDELVNVAGEYDQRWKCAPAEVETRLEWFRIDTRLHIPAKAKNNLCYHQDSWWRDKMREETPDDRRRFSMMLQRIHTGALTLAESMRTATPVGEEKWFTPEEAQLILAKTAKKRGSAERFEGRQLTARFEKLRGKLPASIQN